MLLSDLRFAVRLLAAQPRFTLLVVLTLALGIGISGAGFSIANAVLLRPLPFEDADRLVALGTTDGRDVQGGVSYLDFEDWRRAGTFAALVAYGDTTVSLSEDTQSAERLTATFLSAHAFRTLGLRPIAGRDFQGADDQAGAAAVVILSHRVWTTRYGQDTRVIGRTVRINGAPATVIGVMPQAFNFPSNSDLWQPLGARRGVGEQPRDRRVLSAFGRLADGATLAQARAELEAVAAGLRAQYPDTNKSTFAAVVDLRQRYVAREVTQLIWVLVGAVLFVLLIACANVANLHLGRAVSRAPEIASRLAIGGTPRHIVRQLLIESTILALLAAIAGVAISWAAPRLLMQALAGASPPYWLDFDVDGRVVLFVALVSVVTGILCGVAPGFYLARTNVQDILHEGGRGGSSRRAWRWTSGLLTVQIAFTLVLLAGAGLMMRSFLALYTLDLGIETAGLTMLRIELPPQRYPAADQRRGFYERLDERLAALPMLDAAAIVTLPPGGGGPRSPITIEGRPDAPGVAPPMATVLTITDGYFRAMGLSINPGRRFTREDGLPGREHAIVNRRFAELHFGSESPIGRRILVAGDYTQASRRSWVTIVGVAPPVRQRNLQQADADPVVYLPHRAFPLPLTTVLVRARDASAPLAALVGEEIRAVDADVPTFDVQPLDRFVSFARWPQRVFGGVFTVLALTAVLVSAIGVYGVTALAVSQRTREIGIRMALGARPRQVVRLFGRRMAAPLLAGLVAGVAGAFAAGPLLRAFLVQTGGRDATTLMAISVVAMTVGAAASLLAARRAATLDPSVALRA